MPEIIEPVFTKTSQNARFLLSENERFGLVFVKTGSINSGTVLVHTGKGGGGGDEPVRRLRWRQFTRGVENTNKTDCISSL